MVAVLSSPKLPSFLFLFPAIFDLSFHGSAGCFWYVGTLIPLVISGHPHVPHLRLRCPSLTNTHAALPKLKKKFRKCTDSFTYANIQIGSTVHATVLKYGLIDVNRGAARGTIKTKMFKKLCILENNRRNLASCKFSQTFAVFRALLVNIFMDYFTDR